jgi:transposase-like protein
MNKRRHWLWRAVDQDGTVLDILVQGRHDQHAAERFLHCVLDSEDGVEPRVIITDKLRSYVPRTRIGRSANAIGHATGSSRLTKRSDS